MGEGCVGFCDGKEADFLRALDSLSDLQPLPKAFNSGTQFSPFERYTYMSMS